ncbi:DUF932 domain-containing protein [Thermodesulfobacteriota bacterium]
MRSNNTFENVLGKVHEMSVNNYDETIPLVDMEFDSLENMWIAGNKFGVLPSAQRLFANRLRTPYSYLARCPEELQAQNLNYWIQREVKKRDTLFCRFDGDKLRAVFTDRYKAIDHMEILSRMIEYGFSSEIEVHYSLDRNLLVLKVPDFTRTFGFGGDDIVPGISIANSEVGILAFSIEAYFYRLVCSNGLISKTSVASRFKHVSRRALDEFPDILRQVVDESEHNQRRFEISTQTHLDNPLATIGTFNSQFQITKKEADTIQSAWEIEQGYTMFHVINAYTRAAQDSDLNTEESYKLERVGGLILSMVKQ